MPNDKPKLFRLTVSRDFGPEAEKWCQEAGDFMHDYMVESGEYDKLKAKLEEQAKATFNLIAYGSHPKK